MSKLVGEELEKDSEFWDGEHGVWESGEEDSFSDQGVTCVNHTQLNRAAGPSACEAAPSEHGRYN